MKIPALILLAAVASLAPAHAQFTPPLGAGPAVGGPRTEMMTLGSVHLSAHEGWKREWLAPLNAKLVDWKPGMVTIERLSGAQCEMMRATPQRYAAVHDHYCADAGGFQRALEMSQPQADAEVRKLLSEWPDSPSAAQRRYLAMLFLAAGERPSALVQWLRLPPDERREGDGLTAEAIQVLERSSGRLSEDYEIGAAVAAAAGLERVHAVDDHTAYGIDYGDEDGFNAWQSARFARLAELPFRKAEADRVAAVNDGQSLLALYRGMNAAGAQDRQVQADFGGAFADASAQHYGRHYGGWWETRNLRMVANIREAISSAPGVRVINIVGASHKPWYDQWARQMADVVVVDAHEVLAD